MMVEFYNSIPENDSIRQVIDNDPYYSQQSVEVRAEEVLAETLAQMLTRRYRGRLHQVQVHATPDCACCTRSL